MGLWGEERFLRRVLPVSTVFQAPVGSEGPPHKGGLKLQSIKCDCGHVTADSACTHTHTHRDMSMPTCSINAQEARCDGKSRLLPLPLLSFISRLRTKQNVENKEVERSPAALLLRPRRQLTASRLSFVRGRRTTPKITDAET